MKSLKVVAAFVFLVFSQVTLSEGVSIQNGFITGNDLRVMFEGEC